jgi:hypothetical protein
VDTTLDSLFRQNSFQYYKALADHNVIEEALGRVGIICIEP